VRAKNRAVLVMPLLILPSLVCRAQSPPPESPPAKTFTLEQAINHALTNYPAVRAALERVSAAQAGENSPVVRMCLSWRAHAPRGPCSAPSPNTRSGRRGADRCSRPVLRSSTAEGGGGCAPHAKR